MRFLATLTLTLLVLTACVPPDFKGGKLFFYSYDKGMQARRWGDRATALKHFRALAEAGDAKAQNMLGVLYESGRKASPDLKQAVHWYRKAAAQGNTAAQHSLATLEKWRCTAERIRPLAEQGQAHAQYNLGVLYANGRGVMQDLIMAYVWSNVAAANGNELASENTQTYAKRLDKSDLKKAQKLSRRCLKKPAKCPEYSDD